MKKYEKIFDHEFCDYLVKYVKENCQLSNISQRINWWMWNIWGNSFMPKYEKEFYDENIKKEIFDKLRPNFNIDDYKLIWLQMTEYSEGTQGLGDHLDSKNNKTFIILLTNNFIGGDTYIDNEKMDFNKGDGIFFDGYNTYHGVREVKTGVRNALNIWLTPKTNKLI
jgi:hypothetical protein